MQQLARGKEEMIARASGVVLVTSTVEGRVVELRKRVGDSVSNGEILATIDPSANQLAAIVYIYPGQPIKPGMDAQIWPTTVKPEDYGFMKGTVETVDEYPARLDDVKGVTGDEQTATQLLGSGTGIKVRIGLVLNAATPSGYAWSTAGPPYRLNNRTRVKVSVVVGHSTPLNYYAVPFFRRLFGAATQG